MYLYEQGKQFPFSTLADAHYTKLEGKYQRGKHTHFYVHSICRKINERMVDLGHSDHHFFQDLAEDGYRWLKQIITGNPRQLAQVIVDFSAHTIAGRYPPLKDGRGKTTKFASMISEVFDYQHFSGKGARYSAYDFCEPLAMNVCPYCNRNYTLTVFHRAGGLVRPELDHFVPKSAYPYLALSFYNLIPSCHLCNANLKHATAMNFADFVHPYVHSLHEIFRFSVRFKEKHIITAADAKKHYGVDFFHGDNDTFEITVKFRQGISFTLKRNAARMLRTFRILDLYNHHKDLVQEIIQSALIYNDDYIDNLVRTFKDDLFRNREDALRLLTHQYVTLEEMPKRPFSKFSADLYEEFGIKI